MIEWTHPNGKLAGNIEEQQQQHCQIHEYNNKRTNDTSNTDTEWSSAQRHTSSATAMKPLHLFFGGNHLFASNNHTLQTHCIKWLRRRAGHDVRPLLHRTKQSNLSANALQFAFGLWALAIVNLPVRRICVAHKIVWFGVFVSDWGIWSNGYLMWIFIVWIVCACWVFPQVFRKWYPRSMSSGHCFRQHKYTFIQYTLDIIHTHTQYDLGQRQ